MFDLNILKRCEAAAKLVISMLPWVTVSATWQVAGSVIAFAAFGEGRACEVGWRCWGETKIGGYDNKNLGANMQCRPQLCRCFSN